MEPCIVQQGRQGGREGPSRARPGDPWEALGGQHLWLVVLPCLVVQPHGRIFPEVLVGTCCVFGVDGHGEGNGHDGAANFAEAAVPRRVRSTISIPNASSGSHLCLPSVLPVAVKLDTLPPHAHFHLHLVSNSHRALPTVHLTGNILRLCNLQVPPLWLLCHDLPRHRLGHADRQPKLDGLVDARDAGSEILGHEEAGEVGSEGRERDEGEEPKPERGHARRCRDGVVEGPSADKPKGVKVEGLEEARAHILVLVVGVIDFVNERRHNGGEYREPDHKTPKVPFERQKRLHHHLSKGLGNFVRGGDKVDLVFSEGDEELGRLARLLGHHIKPLRGDPEVSKTKVPVADNDIVHASSVGAAEALPRLLGRPPRGKAQQERRGIALTHVVQNVN
mmetsp:Transcript_149/g.414  ORF Transcript_149/g.414 Transcript_149/m.414 type:complete len:392 (+) Transcript_149:1239-2414(+)